MRLLLIEGPPGSGKSMELEALNSLKQDAFLIHEFHSKRRTVSRHYGLFHSGKWSPARDAKTARLEDRLEEMILKTRFIDLSDEFEDLKLRLFRSRLEFISSLPKDSTVIKEGLLSCLPDRCSSPFLSSLASSLRQVEGIFFLDIGLEELLKRQHSRFTKRGKYNDQTLRDRLSLFNEQFRKVAGGSGTKVTYLDASKDIKTIAGRIAEAI